MAEHVNFTLHAAIRPGTGLTTPWSCPLGSFECPDEPCGCPYTRWSLCGTQYAGSQEDEIRFSTCFDNQNIPYSSDWAQYMNPMWAAGNCSTTLKLPWDKIQACGGDITGDFASGDYTEVVGVEGNALAAEAAKYFYDTFPSRRGVENAMFDVPHLYINDMEQNLDNLESIWNVTKVLCGAGASAAPVCTGIATHLAPLWEKRSSEIVV